MRIVTISHVPFKPEIGTPYHLTVAFARHLPTCYVAPASGWRVEWQLRRQAYRLHPEISLISPFLPGGLRFVPKRWRTPLVRVTSYASIAFQLRRWRDQPCILWSWLSPIAVRLAHFLNCQLFCYHRLDDFSAMDIANIPLEAQLWEQADLIFICAPVLSPPNASAKTVLLRNAVQLEYFLPEARNAQLLPEDLATIPEPRIGYIGAIHPDWFDLELLFELVVRHPEWSFVIIGPKIFWHPKEPLPPNLFLLGARPYKQLAQYLHGLDVCLIPFRDNAITHGASPLKLYEYLAGGKAVVSVPFSDSEELPEGLVWWVQGVEAFEKAIQEALALAHEPTAIRNRIEAVKPHSWEARAETALRHIQEALHHKQASLTAPDRC